MWLLSLSHLFLSLFFPHTPFLGEKGWMFRAHLFHLSHAFCALSRFIFLMPVFKFTCQFCYCYYCYYYSCIFYVSLNVYIVYFYVACICMSFASGGRISLCFKSDNKLSWILIVTTTMIISHSGWSEDLVIQEQGEATAWRRRWTRRRARGGVWCHWERQEPAGSGDETAWTWTMGARERARFRIPTRSKSR